MAKLPLKTNSHLNQLAIDIEFLLISVIQGVALAALVTNAAQPVDQFQLQYWPYILSGFIFILVFWSQAIVHALSFISWPLDLTHSFLYFLTSFMEVMTFGHLEDPRGWFMMMTVTFIIVEGLYLLDYRLILELKDRYKNEKEKVLYKHICYNHLLEAKYFVPLAILFNATASASIHFYPDFFLGRHFHLIFIGVQCLIGLAAIIYAKNSFSKRSLLLSLVR